MQLSRAATSIALALGLLTPCIVGPAMAAPDEAALTRARTQFQQALALEAAGNFAGALSLFQAVGNVKMTPQVRYHIGICEEGLGRLLLATGDYQLAITEGQESSSTTVVSEATERLDKLKSRIPRLVIKRGPGAEHATVVLDDTTLGSAAIGPEMPLDPGPHSLTAKATGHSPFTTTFSLAERELKEITLTLAPEAAPQASASAAPAAPPPPSSAAEPTATAGPMWPVWVAGGVGVAGLAASGIFFALRQSAISDLDAQCGPQRNACPASSESTFNSGKTYSTLAGVSLGVGVVGLGVASVLFFTRDSGQPSTSSAQLRLVPSAPQTLGGASLLGRF